MNDYQKYPTLKRLVARHEKRKEAFETEASKLFHPHALTLCRRIKKGIPEFEGCQLAMRELFLEPSDLEIPITGPDGPTTERLGNILDYFRYERSEWVVNLPQDVINALLELDALADYIDDNYSMVSELVVQKFELTK